MRNSLLLLLGAYLLAAVAIVPRLASADPLVPPVLAHPHVTVPGPQVVLGDVFANAGDARGAVIAQAPDVGRPLVLDAHTLLRLARAFDLSWRPSSVGVRTVVERESKVVPASHIRALIEDALEARGVRGDGLVVDMTTAISDLRVPVGAEISVARFAYEPSRRRFSAVLSAAADGSRTERTHISGHVAHVVAVPVLSQRMRRGDPIGIDDVQWLEVRDGRLPANAILDEDGLVGLTARRSLRPGVPVLSSDVRPPTVVEKGAVVTMKHTTPAMTLTVRGLALEDGALGDVVRVSNLQSHSVVVGIVSAAGEILVGGGRDHNP
jgi:flagella basal body P-ring formation protein FlgA